MVGLLLDVSVIVGVVTSGTLATIAADILAFIGAPPTGGGSMALGAAATGGLATLMAMAAASPAIGMHVTELVKALTAIHGAERVREFLRRSNNVFSSGAGARLGRSESASPHAALHTCAIGTLRAARTLLERVSPARLSPLRIWQGEAKALHEPDRILDQVISSVS